MKNERLLIVSAHAGDFVWRSGGTIAKYIEEGAEVKLVVLSFGVRGESNDLWKKGNQTYDNVMKIRLEESQKAAKILGLTDYEYWGLVDYPIELNREYLEKLVVTIREFRPTVILTHDEKDAFNPDHDAVRKYVHQASVMSNSAGVEIENLKVTKQMKIFGFEPHQTEISNFYPDVFIDISSTFDKKIKAMECFQAQKHLIDYYSKRATIRGNNARRISGNSDIEYAETFKSFYPRVTNKF